MNVRKAILAGSWYPDSPVECEREINRFLGDIKVEDSFKEGVVGGVVPHAGWYFSGSIACNVINCLKDEKQTDVVIIFGMHLHPESSCYIMKEGSWETPFGEIPVHKELAGELAGKFTFNIETSEYFVRDNTIELQLPFIKYFFEDTKIVPVGVPPAENSFDIGRKAAEIASSLGLRVKVIGSTDLTHYGPNYGFVSKGTGRKAVDWVRKNDRRIIDAMLTMDSRAVVKEAMLNQNACCSGAAATAIAAAKKLGATRAECIAYNTSYDKNPDESFVGYTGIVFKY